MRRPTTSAADKLTLRQLEVFLIVIEKRSVTLAATVLGISQPAISKTLQQIEQLLGAPLFIREAGRLIPNELGRSLVPKARAVVAAMDSLTASFIMPPGSLQGEIIVGASTTIAAALMPRIIGLFHKTNPFMKIKMQVANYRDITARLLDYEIDLGVLAAALGHPEIDFRPWAIDRLCVICSPLHPLSSLEKLSPQHLASVPWVVRESGSGTREAFTAALGKHGIVPKIEYELGANDSVRRGVMENLGVGCMSTALVRDDVAEGRLKILKTPFLDLSRTFYIATKKNRGSTPLLSAFIHFLLSCQDTWKDAAFAHISDRRD